MKRIALHRKSDQPLYAQLRDALEKAIADNTLKPGEQLPPVAAFAKDLGVTQTTVRRALKDLIAAGLVGAHVGRGTFVLGPEERAGKRQGAVDAPPPGPPAGLRDPEFVRAARNLRSGIGKSLEALTALTRRPGLISFTSGTPDPAIAADGVLERMAREALRHGQGKYQDYSLPLGSVELREEIARRYSGEGNPITPDQVLLTSGSQQALSLLAQSMMEERPRVLCETPCYMGIPEAFAALGHWVESVPRDDQGPQPERLDRVPNEKPPVLYLVPFLHNPMGTDLGPARRKHLAEWARVRGAVVVSDEIFRDLSFEKNPPPSLRADLGPDRTAVIGSLSKSFMCGLRIGWIVGSRRHIESLGALKRLADIGCPPLIEGMALALLQSGEYDRHLEAARRHYRKRRDALVEALERRMPEGVRWTVPGGGFHLWMELPEGYSSIVLFLLAIERGVTFIPGPRLDIDHRSVNGLRLSYGSLDESRIREGVDLLAEAVEDLLREAPGRYGLGGLGDFI